MSSAYLGPVSAPILFDLGNPKLFAKMLEPLSLCEFFSFWRSEVSFVLLIGVPTSKYKKSNKWFMKSQNRLKNWWQQQKEKYCCDSGIFDYKKFVTVKKKEPEVRT